VSSPLLRSFDTPALHISYLSFVLPFVLLRRIGRIVGDAMSAIAGFTGATGDAARAAHPMAIKDAADAAAAQAADHVDVDSIAQLLKEDDGVDVTAVVAAHLRVIAVARRHARMRRIGRPRRYCGSSPRRSANKRRDFGAGVHAIFRDYFGVDGEAPVYDDRDFERRFRVPRTVFQRVYLAVKNDPFFQQRINAMGKLQAHPLQKVVPAFRVIGYGEAVDRADEYVRLSRTVVAKSMELLMEFIVKRWGPTYLRRPNAEEFKTILQRNKERGMPGCIGSLDCCHWQWHQCPTGMAGMYQSRKGKRGIVIEAVCDEDLWVWHLYVGSPGGLNDLNVMHQSPLCLDVTAGRWPPRNMPYTINGRTTTLPCYLVDGIYPRFAFLMSPHPQQALVEQKTFNRLQEAIRKDVERLLGVLMQRFHVALHPGRYRKVSKLVTTYQAICILHNMCEESRRGQFLGRRRRSAAHGSAGDPIGGGCGGETSVGSAPGGSTGAESGQAGGAGDGNAPGSEGGSNDGPADGVGSGNAPGGEGGAGYGTGGGAGWGNASGADDGDGSGPGGAAEDGDGTGAVAKIGDAGAAAAGGIAAGGGGTAATGGALHAALGDVGAAGQAPPVIKPVAHPPAAGFAAIIDSWTETQSATECVSLRNDLTADIYRERAKLLAPYTGGHDV